MERSNRLHIMMRLATGFALSTLLLVLLLHPFSSLQAQEKIWAGTKCHNSSATLTAFMPEGEPKAAIVVCPGGSYHWHDMDAEGIKVAQWLASEGYAAYVLKYRVAGKFEFASKYRTFFRGHRHPDMLCDIQRAIQLVRERYSGPVGAMGFSAGGHLVMSAGEYFGTNFLARYNIEPSVSLRPDFVAPIYPVVTLSAPPVHKRSRLGEWTVLKQEMRDSLSLEKHVKADTPPVFLLNCVDDPVVDYRNSELLDSALTARGIPHLYMQYKTGGHGFGANPDRQNEYTSHWQKEFMDWIKHYGH